jgi:hypothetical protein
MEPRDPHLVRLVGWVAVVLSVVIAVIWVLIQQPWVHTHPAPPAPIVRIR